MRANVHRPIDEKSKSSYAYLRSSWFGKIRHEEMIAFPREPQNFCLRREMTGIGRNVRTRLIRSFATPRTVAIVRKAPLIVALCKYRIGEGRFHGNKERRVTECE